MDKQAITNLTEAIKIGHSISQEEAVQLAKTSHTQALLSASNELRIWFCGTDIDLCSITNARSGKCGENCKWCSQSVHNKAQVDKYELVDKETVHCQARKHAQEGVHRYSLVTSGRAVTDSNLQELLTMYRELNQTYRLKLCASMGLLTRQQLQQLKDAGVSHYHCNMETARSNFHNLCTTHTYDEKITTIKMAMEVGLDVCSGGIIGMGESMEQRLELAFDLRALGIQSVPINLLNPIAGTPLEGTPPLSDDEILKTFALFRFILPSAKIRFAGGRLQMKHLQQQLLKGGVNAALVGDLLTTVGNGVQDDLAEFKNAGFTITKQ